MAYATDRATFTAQMTQATQMAAPRPVWAGIGAYRLSSSDTVENIRIARSLGAAGVVLFSYDALISLPTRSRVPRAGLARRILPLGPT